MFLLDTSVFLKLWMRPEAIRADVTQVIADEGEPVYVSAATAWEITIKHSTGKLQVPGDPLLYVPRRIREGRFLSLAITIEHALGVHALPLHHLDPFDRILVAQAQSEGLTLVTTDKQLTKYDVRLLMA